MRRHGKTRRFAARWLLALPIAFGAAATVFAMAVAPVAAAATTGSDLTGSAAPAPTVGPDNTPSGALVPGTPCTASAKACVDLANKQAWLISDGAVTRGPVDIEPGPAEEPTPVGTFNVQWKDPHHISDMPNHAPMPYSVFFANGGVAFHEGSLRNYSAGCVHLAHDDAMAFYDALSVGDQVQVLAGSLDSTPQAAPVG
jgi:L,D-transpeptidase catalytic domain